MHHPINAQGIRNDDLSLSPIILLVFFFFSVVPNPLNITSIIQSTSSVHVQAMTIYTYGRYLNSQQTAGEKEHDGSGHYNIA